MSSISSNKGFTFCEDDIAKSFLHEIIEQRWSIEAPALLEKSQSETFKKLVKETLSEVLEKKEATIENIKNLHKFYTDPNNSNSELVRRIVKLGLDNLTSQPVSVTIVIHKNPTLFLSLLGKIIYFLETPIEVSQTLLNVSPKDFAQNTLIREQIKLIADRHNTVFRALFQKSNEIKYAEMDRLAAFIDSPTGQLASKINAIVKIKNLQSTYPLLSRTSVTLS